MNHVSTSFLKYNNKIISISGYESDHIYQTIARWKIFYEKNLLVDIAKHLKNKKGTIIDGGANLGNHSLFFSLFCSATKVISYEPHIPNLKMLKKNIKDNNLESKIDVRNVGLSDKETFLELSFFSQKNYGATQFSETLKPTAIKSVTLDADCEKENISCIKLDIQGKELQTLKGATYILNTQDPLLVVEAIENNEFTNIENFLKKFKYQLCPASKNKKHYNSSPTYIFKK